MFSERLDAFVVKQRAVGGQIRQNTFPGTKRNGIVQWVPQHGFTAEKGDQADLQARRPFAGGRAHLVGRVGRR